MQSEEKAWESEFNLDNIIGCDSGTKGEKSKQSKSFWTQNSLC